MYIYIHTYCTIYPFIWDEQIWNAFHENPKDFIRALRDQQLRLAPWNLRQSRMYKYSPLKTTMSPENQWLEEVFFLFLKGHVVFLHEYIEHHFQLQKINESIFETPFDPIHLTSPPKKTKQLQSQVWFWSSDCFYSLDPCCIFDVFAFLEDFSRPKYVLGSPWPRRSSFVGERKTLAGLDGGSGTTHQATTCR